MILGKFRKERACYTDFADWQEEDEKEPTRVRSAAGENQQPWSTPSSSWDPDELERMSRPLSFERRAQGRGQSTSVTQQEYRKELRRLMNAFPTYSEAILSMMDYPQRAQDGSGEDVPMQIAILNSIESRQAAFGRSVANLRVQIPGVTQNGDTNQGGYDRYQTRSMIRRTRGPLSTVSASLNNADSQEVQPRHPVRRTARQETRRRTTELVIETHPQPQQETSNIWDRVRQIWKPGQWRISFASWITCHTIHISLNSRKRGGPV